MWGDRTIIITVLFGYVGLNIVLMIPCFVLYCITNRRSGDVHMFPFDTFFGWIILNIALIIDAVIVIVEADLSEYVLVGIGGFIYCCFALYCMWCIVKFTGGKLDAPEFERTLKFRRNSRIRLSFYINAYHTEKREWKDADGVKHKEKYDVTTVSKTLYWLVPYWVDVTDSVILPPTAYANVVLQPHIVWCHGSDSIIERARSELYERNRHLDEHVSVSKSISCCSEREVIVRNPVIPSTFYQRCLLDPIVGCIASLFGFGVQMQLLYSRVIPDTYVSEVKMASLVEPLVDEHWLAEQNIVTELKIARPTAKDRELTDDYVGVEPMFENPKPLYKLDLNFADTVYDIKNKVKPSLPIDTQKKGDGDCSLPNLKLSKKQES